MNHRVGHAPIVDLLLGLILRRCVALLDGADQPITLACDRLDILIRQSVPAHLEQAFDLFSTCPAVGLNS